MLMDRTRREARHNCQAFFRNVWVAQRDLTWSDVKDTMLPSCRGRAGPPELARGRGAAGSWPRGRGRSVEEYADQRRIGPRRL